jgi:hypothetical protein
VADLTALRRNFATRAATCAHIAEGTADKLDGVGDLPAVKVLDYDGQVTGRPGGNQELTTLRLRGVLLVASPGSKGDAVLTLDACLEELRVAYRLGIKCGMPTVVHDSWLDRWDSGVIEFAEEEFIGADLEWEIQLDEVIATRTA